MKQLICPISNEKVNENITRLNALITILLISSGYIFNSVMFPLMLLLDFSIRAYGNSKFSPVSYISSGIVLLLQLQKKPIDKAPKIFAARMGLLMTFIIAILFGFGFYTASLIIASILAFFAALEFVFGICVGCYIYTYIVLPAFR